jgi:hypothetical protein
MAEFSSLLPPAIEAADFFDAKLLGRLTLGLLACRQNSEIPR